MAGLALPWYGAMINRYGAGFLSHAPFFPYAQDASGPWLVGKLVLPVLFLVIGFFPWSAALPGAMSHAAVWWRKLRQALPGVRLCVPCQVERDREQAAAASPYNRRGSKDIPLR